MPTVSQYLRVPRLDSIRSRILALAVFGTLVPSAVALGIAYRQNRQASEAQITHTLSSTSTQTSRAMGNWFRDRLYDLRVFAGSDEVSSNLSRYAVQGLPSTRLREYLRSLHERFPDFDQLLVLDVEGRVLATSAQQNNPVALPVGWQTTLRTENQLIGDAYWDPASKKGKLIVVVPVQRADGRLLGAFAAELNLAPVQHVLRSYATDSVSTTYVLTSEGAFLASSREISAELLRAKLAPGVLERMSDTANAAIAYAGVNGQDVVGTMSRVPQMRWEVISEIPTDAAFSHVRRFRNVALLSILALMIVMAASAYRLGLLIVRPLERLATAAAEVASGDLDVDLRNSDKGEVGALTGVFNDMVSRLREGRVELQKLSVTDGLTGLANHRAMMLRLNEEALRSHRSGRPFAVLMADVDNFKSYNDTFGHPAGDEVLRKVASILSDATRGVDCVARYGGEEFCILLAETDLPGAAQVAERIRARVETELFPGRVVTMSLGVAEFPKNGDAPQSILEVADAVLYEAKREGRNRVVQARPPAKKEVLPTAKRPSRATKKRS